MITNNSNLHMVWAVWLASDDYDGTNDHQSISVTTLLKSTRAIVLGSRLNGQPDLDVAHRAAARYGTAIHEAVEKAWRNNPEEILKQLGYPAAIVDVLRIEPEEPSEDYFDVYMEQRVSREFGGFRINGAYDFIVDGEPMDIKTTGVYTWVNQTKEKDYPLQMSLYKWLNSDKATEGVGTILFAFTDWNAGESRRKKNYPHNRFMDKQYPLMNQTDMEHWLRVKLGELRSYWESPEAELPLCTPEELWQRDPVYKYYKDPNNRKRSNGNFDNPVEAQAKRDAHGGIGVIIPVYSEPRACLYCAAFSLCSQGQGFVRSGALTIQER